MYALLLTTLTLRQKKLLDGFLNPSITKLSHRIVAIFPFYYLDSRSLKIYNPLMMAMWVRYVCGGVGEWRQSCVRDRLRFGVNLIPG